MHTYMAPTASKKPKFIFFGKWMKNFLLSALLISEIFITINYNHIHFTVNKVGNSQTYIALNFYFFMSYLCIGNYISSWLLRDNFCELETARVVDGCLATIFFLFKMTGWFLDNIRTIFKGRIYSEQSLSA